jgi:hypothetical protein
LDPRGSDRLNWMIPVKEDPLEHQQGMERPDWYHSDRLDPLLIGLTDTSDVQVVSSPVGPDSLPSECWIDLE